MRVQGNPFPKRKAFTGYERDKVKVGNNRGLEDNEARELVRVARSLNAEALTLRGRELRFGPFCGVIQTPQVTMELLPKIEAGQPDPKAMRGLLVQMLNRAGETGIKWGGEADLDRQDCHLLDVFIEDFCSRVKRALRGGAIARYSERTENLTVVRGRLELTAHFRMNAFDHSRLFCRFDERSIDNPHNQVLKAVLRRFLAHALSSRTRTTVASLLQRFDQVADTEHNIGASNVKALLSNFDRTIKHWEPVFRYAEWLLGGFPDVRKGSASGIALLFNMEELFEKVLGFRIKSELPEVAGPDLTVELQSEDQPVHLARGGHFRLYPDIIVRNRNCAAEIFILDAKWKFLRVKKPGFGVSNGDVYQMNAYASGYGCDHLVLVYPASRYVKPGHVGKFELKAGDQTVQLRIIAVDIRELTLGSGLPPGFKKIFQR